MDKEIERKFLIIRNYPKPISSRLIFQYYIMSFPEQRIRLEQIDDTEIKCYHTIKNKGDLIRTEDEYEVEPVIYHQWDKIRIGKVIHKIRHNIKLGNNLIAELDVYRDYYKGLSTTEVEFNSIEGQKISLFPSGLEKK